MKTLTFEQMEQIQGGANKVACALAIAGALVIGTGGVIAAAATGGGAIGFAILSNWWAWGNAAYTCYNSR
jgi:hypothetical protein